MDFFIKEYFQGYLELESLYVCNIDNFAIDGRECRARSR
jgi:hypothetical protein